LTGVLLGAVAATGIAAEPAKPGPPGIVETQLTLRLNPMQGRATVIEISDQTLTIVTAAHFLAADDVGKPIQIHHDGNLTGRLVAVARNPGFHPIRSRATDEEMAFGTLGVDTAVAVITLDLRSDAERRVFEKIRAADMTLMPVPNVPNQILTVNIVDQNDEEHVVRAGNHLNPKCLAWGRRNYDTQRGDSGAGVFVMRKTSEGETVPVLIGNVSQTDDRGGIASLASRGEQWVNQALTEQRLAPK
jgi:hypothetical protein